MVSLEDDSETIRKKLKKAYCVEKEVEGNPVLEIAKYVIMPQIATLKVKRPEKFGGTIYYTDYAKLEKDFSAGKLHPADLKNAVAESLVEILKPAK